MEPSIVISIISLLVSTVMTVVLFYVGAKLRKIDNLEEQLRAAASDAVDLRFSKLSGEMSAAISTLKAVVGEIQRRLERGDDQFSDDAQARHKLELKTQQQIAEMHAKFATREDLQRITDRLERLQASVAALLARDRIAPTSN